MAQATLTLTFTGGTQAIADEARAHMFGYLVDGGADDGYRELLEMNSLTEDGEDVHAAVGDCVRDHRVRR